MNKFDLEIINILHKINIPRNVLGYGYIQTAVRLISNKPELIHSITKELYPKVAEIHRTMPSRVERAIRHAFTLMRCGSAVRKEIFGADGHLKNGEYLASMAECIEVKLAKEEMTGVGGK